MADSRRPPSPATPPGAAPPPPYTDDHGGGATVRSASRSTRQRHRHRQRRHHRTSAGGRFLDPGLADYNVRHRTILANSCFNLSESQGSGRRGARNDHDDDNDNTVIESPVRSRSNSSSPSPSREEESQEQTENEGTESIASQRIHTLNTTQSLDTIPPVASLPPPPPPRIVSRLPHRLDNLDIFNSEAFCRASLSSVETYPPRQHRKDSHSSEDSHRTVPKRRGTRRRGTPRGTLGISPVHEGSPLSSTRDSHYNPLPTLAASSPADKGASEVNKMYLETKINMLEIIQSGLQLKLDMQCVREQFLSLLESYAYAEETFIRRPSHLQPAATYSRQRHQQQQQQHQGGESSPKPISAGRARVRALYDARRARIQARRERFEKEMAIVAAGGIAGSNSGANTVGGCTPRSSKSHIKTHKPVAGTSSEGLSDSTSFDDWELKSVSSGDILDTADCSHHRHKNSPSSEGVGITNSSPDSDIPLGGAANSSSCGGNTSTSSDGTSLITKLTQQTSVSDKENVHPEHYEDAKNNNIINSSLSDTQSQHSRGSGCSGAKLETITEEQQRESQNGLHRVSPQAPQQPSVILESQALLTSNNNLLPNSALPSRSDIHSYCSQDVDTHMDIDMDDNGYVIMKGLDPSIMDYDMSYMGGGAGEALQSRLSGFSHDFSHELPRSCHSSYNFPMTSPLRDTSIPISSPLRDTSIPIYTARSSKDIEGEYVMLKSPYHSGGDLGDYVTLEEPSHAPSHSMMSFYEMNMEPSMLLKPDTTSSLAWNTSRFNITGNFGPKNIITSSQMLPPMQSSSALPKKDCPKYATSELITQLYTKDRSLRDISNISQVSRAGLNDTTMGDSTIGSILGLGSPDSYPLNSTMKTGVQNNNNTMQSIEDSDDTLENIADDMLDPSSFPKRSFDQRTSFSEPSDVLHHREATPLSLSSPKSMDDSFLDNYEPDHNQSNSQIYDSEDFVTPKRKMPKKPKLCKEHGLHPTFGGPCIFEDSFDVLDSSTEEEESQSKSSHHTNSSPTKSQRSRSRTSSSHYATETDCDSSYLSECVDDTHFSNDFGQTSDHYMYDARNARMKMMKRQTGQTDINHCKPPIGLSETDLHFDVTRKHLSLEATITSLPDLANLSVPPSECSEDQDSTLKLTDQSTGPSIVATDGSSVFNNAIQDRPLSISTIATTTTDESPESNGGIAVPVNSPNVTDSGSSRPTTDNYDYVDIPRDIIPKQDIKMPPPRFIPPRRKPGVGSSSRSVTMSTRPYSTYGSSSSSYSGPVNHRNISGSLGSIPHKSQQYYLQRSQDSLHKSQQPLHKSQQPMHKSQQPLYKSQQPLHKSQQPLHRSQHSLSQKTTTLPRRSGHRSDGKEPYSSSSSSKRYPRSGDSNVETQPHHHHHGTASHYDVREQSSRRRSVMDQPATSSTNAQNLSKERKKVLAKKLKQFSNNFHNSTGNLQIKTLGHF